MTSTSALHRKYTTWLAERGYQPMTADQLSLQIQGNQPRSSLPADKFADVQWLDEFIREWNAAADREDAGGEGIVNRHLRGEPTPLASLLR